MMRGRKRSLNNRLLLLYKWRIITYTNYGDSMDNLFDVNITEIIDITIRGIVSLIVLFLFTKIIGKHQISQLSLFDYIVGITIGSLAAEMTFF